MMHRKDLRLEQYNISRMKYRELKYFCLQYPEWKHELAVYTDALRAPVITDMPAAHNGSDSTANTALRRAEIENKCAAVEQAAQEANQYIATAIIKNVTEGTPYEYMNVPCGRRQFYDDRRKFFYYLSKKR